MKIMKKNITGHMKNLNKAEWLEGCASFITEAKALIRRSSQHKHFGRGYLLEKAEQKLDLAEKCADAAQIAEDVDDFF
jgi:hypothetical protein